MPTRVQLPNGQIGEFPDGMTPQQIEAVLQKQFPAPIAATDSAGRTPTGEKAPGDTRNGFQRFADNLSTPDPRREEWQSPTERNAGGFGTSLAASVLQPIAHPVNTAKSLMGAIAAGRGDPTATAGELLRPMIEKGIGDYQKHGGLYAASNAAGSLTGAAASGEVAGGLGRLASPVLAPIGEAMQRGGEGIINRTVGAVKSDFARGANPGKGYFQAKLGPSASMGSIANKAANAHEATGAAIGEAIDNGAGAGVKIPTSKVAAAVNEPADAARSVLNGPFGPGSDALDQRMSTFGPHLYPEVPTGPMEMTPPEVFGLKRNVAQNVGWSDPTQVGLKRVGQQITGGLSGVLSDDIPELRDLNSTYQNTGKLADRAAYRSDTGISPITQMGRRAVEGALGAGLGYATHHPLLSVLPLAADSVPVRTGLASGLYYGGKTLSGAGPAVPVTLGPAAAIGGIQNKKPKEEPDEK